MLHFTLNKPLSISRRVFLLPGLLFVLLTGCTATGPRGNWGAEATLTPGWNRVGTAAADALLSPCTWGPALGAAAFRIDHLDTRISDWAREETPLFGSTDKAANASDDLRLATELAWLTTGLAAPSGETLGSATWNKVKGLGIGYAAIKGTDYATSAVKKTADRTRPDASNDLSFPSGHSSHASVAATLAGRNLDYLSLPPAGKRAGNVALGALVAGTGWARIEAGKHYPSDVLAGAALGHFLGAFINDAFLGIDAQPIVELSRTDLFFGLTWVR